MTLQCCGCGKSNTESTENNDAAEAENSGTSEESGSSGEDLFLSLTDLPWRDNSLDAYSAVLNMPLRYTEQENAVGGVGMYILGVPGLLFLKSIFSNYEFPLPQQLKVDAQGNLHMITSRDDNSHHYYIVASDGTFLMEVSPKEGFLEGKTPDLFFLYDGRVGMRLGEQLQCVDVETGQTEVLANIKEDYRYCILWDEKTLLYADGKGLYRSRLSGENPEILYTWSNHGISASEIRAMQVTESGGISLIYMDYKGANYMRLTPTTEEVEIQEITFGVYGNGSQYQAAVAAFNKRHPAYRVRINTYELYDTGLLTELAAGKGPVLVDTLLTGFENNAEWWEPLDEVFRQMKLDEELIPKVLDAGRINGTLYGVVTDFSLNTVVTFAEEPVEWDYDTFLDCFDENGPSIKSVYTPIYGTGGYSFIATFFTMASCRKSICLTRRTAPHTLTAISFARS